MEEWSGVVRAWPTEGVWQQQNQTDKEEKREEEGETIMKI